MENKTSFVLPPLTGWRRAVRFFRRPLSHQYYSVALRVQTRFPKFQFPIRLPFGSWFWAEKDYVSAALLQGSFELSELAFVSRFLRSGQTVLDIGAHHGLYTLLASRLTGPTGKVISFEPSPRENSALRRNLLLNRCRNVETTNIALGDHDGECVLYVVREGETGCNSLRPPSVGAASSPVSVKLTTVDSWLEKHHAGSVHFIKLDVEGGELGVLQGAERLLSRQPRPVILAEVQDVRTLPWGYPARRIIEFLLDRGFDWYSIGEDGSLRPFVAYGNEVDGNFVAWPRDLPRTI